MQVLDAFIDHAPLFPPASLTTVDAIEAHIEARRGPRSSALHSLVWPASRAHEIAELSAERGLAVALVGQPATITEAIDRYPQLDVVQSETTYDASERLTGRACYVEVPSIDIAPTDLQRMLDRLATANLAAKIRCGGAPSDPVPTARTLAEFVVGCAQRQLPFKATAGLHHAWHDLVGETGATRHHGLMNLLLAAAAATSGGDLEAIHTIMVEPPRHVAPTEITSARTLFRHLGTCSFDEPLDNLAAWFSAPALDLEGTTP